MTVSYFYKFIFYHNYSNISIKIDKNIWDAKTIFYIPMIIIPVLLKSSCTDHGKRCHRIHYTHHKRDS